MKSLELAQEFNALSQVVRLSDATQKFETYSVVVGIPNTGDEGTFLANGNTLQVDGFVTPQDARRAYELCGAVLAVVDENLASGLKMSLVRDEVLDAIAREIKNALDAGDGSKYNVPSSLQKSL